MNGPLILISKPRIKRGKSEGFAAWAEEFSRLAKETEPRLLAFNVYESADHASPVIIQIHPDADSLEYHQKLGHASSGLDYADVDVLELYGPPSAALSEWANRGIVVYPVHRAGFTRLQS